MDGTCLQGTHAFVHLWILDSIATYHHACMFDTRLIAELSRRTKETNVMEKGRVKGEEYRGYSIQNICI